MRGSSTRRPLWIPYRHESGFALGWVGGLLTLLGLVAFSLWFMTTTTQANLVRAISGQAYLDICISALSETQAEIRESVQSGSPFHGLTFHKVLAKEYPFDAITVDPVQTRKLVAQLYPGVTLSTVAVNPIGRSRPGAEDPLLGIIELVVQAKGRLGGITTGREVTHRLVFSVPCALQTFGSDQGSYMRIHWGTPNLSSTPVATVVKRL